MSFSKKAEKMISEKNNEHNLCVWLECQITHFKNHTSNMSDKKYRMKFKKFLELHKELMYGDYDNV